MFGRRRNAGGRNRDLVTQSEADLAVDAGETGGDNLAGAVGPWGRSGAWSSPAPSTLARFRLTTVHPFVSTVPNLSAGRLTATKLGEILKPFGNCRSRGAPSSHTDPGPRSIPACALP